MTDRLKHGSASRGQMRKPWAPTSHGRLSHGRGLELLTAREQRRLLPDFECEHGRLSGDPTEVCGCWFDEAFLVPRWDRRFRPECGGCGLSCDPGALVCVGCGRKLGVTV